MTLRVVIDVNLSPEWVSVLRHAGFDAVHWVDVGSPSALDAEIMGWASANDYAIFSHDLDFSTMLALTRAEGPSLIQIRGPQVLPEQMADVLVQTLHRFRAELEAGALLLIEPGRSRVRILPL